MSDRGDLLGRLSSFADENPSCQENRTSYDKIDEVMSKRFHIVPKEAVQNTLDEKKHKDVNQFNHPFDGLFSAAMRTNIFTL